MAEEKRKKKDYLPIFKALQGEGPGYDLAGLEGASEGFVKSDADYEDDGTGWRGNLDGCCAKPEFRFPKHKGKQHPVSLWYFYIFNA